MGDLEMAGMAVISTVGWVLGARAHQKLRDDKGAKMHWTPSRPMPAVHVVSGVQRGESVLPANSSGLPPTSPNIGVLYAGLVLPNPSPPLWRCMCDGCGAPLQRADVQCGYCLRATMAAAPLASAILTSPGPVSDATASALRSEWPKGHTNSAGPR